MTTQNDCKGSGNPMKMVSDVIIQTFSLISVIWGLFWPFLATFSQFWPQTQNWRRLVMWPLKMTAREAEIHWRWFQMAISMDSGHFRPSCVILGPKWLQWAPKLHNLYTKWPRLFESDIWSHLHQISARLVIVLRCHKTSLRQICVPAQKWLLVAPKGHKMDWNDLNPLKLPSETISIGLLLLMRSFWVVTW